MILEILGHFILAHITAQNIYTEFKICWLYMAKLGYIIFENSLVILWKITQ